MDYRPFYGISKRVKSKLPENIDDRIYYICLCIIIILFNLTCSAFEIENYPLIYRCIRISRYTILFVMLLNAIFISGEFTLKELIIYVPVGILLLIITKNAGEKNLLFSFLVIISSKGRSLRRAAKVYLFTYLNITAVVIGLFAAGLIPDFVMIRTDGTVRHSLGFNHPNLLGVFLFTMIISFLVAYPKEKQSVLFYLAVSAVIAFIWIVPNSITAALCVLVLTVAYSLRKVRIWKTAFGKALLYMAPPVFCAISIFGAVFFNRDSRFMSMLNTLVSGRLSLAHDVINEAGIAGLFGNNISYVGLPVDNCYDRMLVFYGVTVLVMFLTVYLYAMYRVASKYRIDLLMFLVVFSFYGMSEVFLIVAMYNIMLLSINTCIDFPEAMEVVT